MSGTQSVTVIGGTSSHTLTGLVTIPLDVQASVASSLQALLGSNVSGTGYSDSVNSGALYLSNINIANDIGNISFGTNSTTVPGILELSNTNADGSITSGNASIAGTEPANFSTLIVQAPGLETITGNGGTNSLDIFAKNSSVHFKTNGGSGTIIGGGSGDQFGITGTAWSVSGSTDGGDFFNVYSGNDTVLTYGAGTLNGAENVVGLFGGNANVLLDGNNDLVETYAGNGTISVASSATVVLNGGNETVFALAGSTSVNAYFQVGGDLDFINSSTVAASVTGDAPGENGGSATTFGGAGGGYYQGGSGGNNSLTGGKGLVTLVGAGSDNILTAKGFGTFSGANALFAGDGATTMIATTATGSNDFHGGISGTDVITSAGQLQQSFFIGLYGSETITGSTYAGATNNYYFQENSLQGGSTEVLTNFNTANGDAIYINAFGTGSVTGVAAGVVVDTITAAIVGGGSVVYLSDGTTIKLLAQSYSANDSVYTGKAII